MHSRLAVLVATLVAGGAGLSGIGQLRDFVPVGVRYVPAADADTRRRDLEEMRRLRFNVVSLAPSGDQGGRGRLSFIDRVLAGAPYPDVLGSADSIPAVVPADGGHGDTTLRAWRAIAGGARAILFDDWSELQRNAESLAAAAAFAEAITRNAALYAPLRTRLATAGRDEIRLSGGGTVVEATILESADALLLIVLNQGREPRKVTMTFSTDVPEAIWRNMFSGASVSFVTGPGGPTYTRTFAPQEVLVLMINTRLR